MKLLLLDKDDIVRTSFDGNNYHEWDWNTGTTDNGNFFE